MSFSSLGIIYSDIGTSPLYVLTTLWSTSGPAPVKEDVIGGISAIIWAFTLLPFLKYVSCPSSIWPTLSVLKRTVSRSD